MNFGPTGQLVAQVILVLNVIIFIVVEWGVIHKALKLPIPEGYPPKNWDWFQKWVENKYFWWELVIFLAISSVLGYVLCL